jgi:uncharacterized membrane-anchored protein
MSNNCNNEPIGYLIVDQHASLEEVQQLVTKLKISNNNITSKSKQQRGIESIEAWTSHSQRNVLQRCKAWFSAIIRRMQ